MTAWCLVLVVCCCARANTRPKALVAKLPIATTVPSDAVAPYAYLTASFIIVDYLAPVMKTWRRLGRFRGQSWGDYRFALTRLGIQAESVASLKGAA